MVLLHCKYLPGNRGGKEQGWGGGLQTKGGVNRKLIFFFFFFFFLSHELEGLGGGGK